MGLCSPGVELSVPDDPFRGPAGSLWVGWFMLTATAVSTISGDHSVIARGGISPGHVVPHVNVLAK